VVQLVHSRASELALPDVLALVVFVCHVVPQDRSLTGYPESWFITPRWTACFSYGPRRWPPSPARLTVVDEEEAYANPAR
jgi:hypothetical protein